MYKWTTFGRIVISFLPCFWGRFFHFLSPHMKWFEPCQKYKKEKSDPANMRKKHRLGRLTRAKVFCTVLPSRYCLDRIERRSVQWLGAKVNVIFACRNFTRPSTIWSTGYALPVPSMISNWCYPWPRDPFEVAFSIKSERCWTPSAGLLLLISCWK